MTVVVPCTTSGSLSNSVCRGALLVCPGSNVYRGTLVGFPGSNFSRGTLLVFPDTIICSNILLHTILWGKWPKIWENRNFLRKSKKKRFWKSITNPEDLMTVVVYHVQHLAPSNSVCRGALLVFPGSNVYRGTLVVFPYSNFSWGTLLVFPDANICLKFFYTPFYGKSVEIFGKPQSFAKV